MRTMTKAMDVTDGVWEESVNKVVARDLADYSMTGRPVEKEWVKKVSTLETMVKATDVADEVEEAETMDDAEEESIEVGSRWTGLGELIWKNRLGWTSSGGPWTRLGI